MKNILCIGGAGQLGQKVISIFSKHNVVNVDFRPHPQARSNLLLDPLLTPTDNYRNVLV
jgi:dTDP-4-dehydrorhamnose reductase